MAIHPDLINNFFNQTQTYDEPEYLVSYNPVYENGVGWYMDQFPRDPKLLTEWGKSTDGIRFEKTASLLTNIASLPMAKALVPDAKFIFVIRDPADRAYSWYQVRFFHQ